MKSQPKDEAYALTQLILEVFRVNGQLIAAGDRLVGELGLTSSRWQVLGALAGDPTTVPQIARTMGLSRQSVQRTANVLEAEGFVSLSENPAHAKASLLSLTTKGRAVLAKATQIQTAWSRTLGRDHRVRELNAAVSVLQKLSKSLQETKKGESR